MPRARGTLEVRGTGGRRGLLLVDRGVLAGAVLGGQLGGRLEVDLAGAVVDEHRAVPVGLGVGRQRVVVVRGAGAA
ncbi:hypothetical protein ACFC0R_41685 [Streptomyces sp. NPDC056086]|uniref:hypothetical protein n=1 Tax=Streptomyces sp. NPDC056086 TaxID=3345709 RepID=UPI0035D8717C